MKKKMSFVLIGLILLVILVLISIHPDFLRSMPSHFYELFQKSRNCNDAWKIQVPDVLPQYVGCAADHFAGVLLVIVFNNPFYNNIPALKRFYGSTFQELYFCGPNETGSVPDSIHRANIGKDGVFSYACMAKAIEDFPDRKGYLYISDDMIVNWWSMLPLRLDRLWQGLSDTEFKENAYIKPGKSLSWWNSWDSWYRCHFVYEDVLRLAGSAPETKRDDFKKSLVIYLQNGRGRPLCGRSYSDFFYVPSLLSAQAQRLLSLCRQQRLHVEVAVPTVLRMLDREYNFVNVNGSYLPKMGIDAYCATAFWSTYNMNMAFVHPFKLNAAGSADINRAQFDTICDNAEKHHNNTCAPRVEH